MNKSRIKWWLNGIAAFIFVAICFVYLLIRPIIVQNLDPVLHEKIGARVNGTISWEQLDLDPGYNLQFAGLELKDNNGDTVLKSSYLTIGWTVSSLYDYLVHDSGVASLVKSVTVEDPEVDLRQGQDNSWNIQDILKPSDDTNSGTFTGKVAIKNGTIAVNTANSDRYVFNDLKGNFDWNKDQKIHGSFNGTFIDNPFNGTLKYTDEYNLEVDLKADSISLKSLQPLLNQFPDLSKKIELKNGTGEATSAKIWRSDGAVAYHVKGHFNNAALSYENYILADGAAFFDIYDGEASFSDVSAKINGQNISGDARINWNLPEIMLQSNLNFHGFEIEKVLPDEQIRGALTGSMLVSGTLKNPYVSGDVVLKNGGYQDMDIYLAKAKFIYGDDGIIIPSLEAKTSAGEITGDGRYDLTSGAFNGEAVVTDLSLGNIPADIGAFGILNGSVEAAGNYKDGAFSLNKGSFVGKGEGLSYTDYSAGNVSGFGSYDSGNWNFTGYARDMSAKGVHVDTLSGNAESTNGVTNISYVTGTMGNGAFTASGVYSDQGMNIKAEAGNIDMGQFPGLAGIPVSGTASLTADIHGTPQQPQADVIINASDGAIKGAAFNTLKGRLTADEKTLTISDAKWTGDSENHTVKGTIGIAEPHNLNLSIKTEKSRIEDLLRLAQLDYPVTGWIENDMSVSGDVDHPVVKGNFLAWDGSIKGELFQSISAGYDYDFSGLKLSNGLAYIYDGTAMVNGVVRPDGLDLQTSFNDISIERMLPQSGITGKVSLLGRVKGTMDNPQFDGTAASREIHVGGSVVRVVSTGVHYRDHVVTLDEGSFRQQGGSFTWKGNYNVENSSIDGTLKFDNWNAKEILRMLKVTSDAVDIPVEGGMRISGTLDNPSVDFKANILGGHLGATSVGDGVIDFSYMNKALSIRKMNIPVGNGVLAAQGGMNSQGDLDIQFAARDMDVSWIPSVLNKKDVKIGGTLTAGVYLSGNKTKPVADISIGVDHPSYGDISFDDFSLMANMSDNVFTLQNALITRDAYKASMKGTIPGAMFGLPVVSDVPIDLDINLDHADMNILALFSKAVTSANGPIKGHLKVTGAYNDPMIFGGVTIKDGSFTLATMSEPISPFNLNLAFNGKTADADMSAVFGGGQASAKGSVNWNNAAITGYSGEAHIHTPSIKSTYYKGALDGDFTLGEVFGQMGISGNLNIHDAVIDVPFALLGSSGSTTMNMLTKVDVSVGDNVRLYNSLLYDMLIRGNVSVMGPVKAPVVTGRVNVEKGDVRINTTDFRADQASAIWGGEPGSLIPVIRANAVTKVGHYNITAELEGPATEMTTVFHSDPYLSDSQILMLLTLHQNPDKDSSGAMEGALFNAGLTMIFGNGVQDFLQDKIGLDLISITSSLTDYYDSINDNNDNYYYIKIGKYIFNDFMLTATMGVNNDEKSVGFHYDLNSRIGLSSWYNSNHDSYIGTDWSFKF